MLTTLDSTLAPMPFPITRPTPPQPRVAEPPEPPEPPAPDADDNDSDDDPPKRPEGWCRHFTDMPAGLSNEEFTARVGHGEFQLPSSQRRRAVRQIAKIDSAIGDMVESWEPRPGLVLEFPKDWHLHLDKEERTRLPTAKDAFSIRATFFGDGLCGFFVDSREPDLYAAYGRELRAVAAKLLEAAATVEALRQLPAPR